MVRSTRWALVAMAAVLTAQQAEGGIFGGKKGRCGCSGGGGSGGYDGGCGGWSSGYGGGCGGYGGGYRGGYGGYGGANHGSYGGYSGGYSSGGYGYSGCPAAGGYVSSSNISSGYVSSSNLSSGNVSPSYYSPMTSNYPNDQTTAMPLADSTPESKQMSTEAPKSSIPLTTDAASAANDIARFTVRLPSPNAQLWIENQQMAGSGTERVFTSPRLLFGRTYQYNIRASWIDGARPVTEQKTLTVQAGRSFDVDFGGRLGASLTPNTGAVPQTATGVETSNYPPTNSSTTKAPTNPDPAPTAGEAVILSVTNREIVVDDKLGGRRTLQVPDDATVLSDGKETSLKDLKSGSNVKITMRTDGSGRISRIEAKSFTQ